MDMARTLLLTVTTLAIAGCSRAPRLDASDPVKFAGSLQTFVASAHRGDKEDRTKAAAVLRSTYLDGTAWRSNLSADVPPPMVLDKMRYDELASLAERIEVWATDGMTQRSDLNDQVTPVEHYWRNSFIVNQLDAQIALLQRQRDIARYRDLFTIDQFSYTNSAFIPPQKGVPLGKDVAVFTTTFQNNAVFNLYSIGFHVLVKDPTLLAPVVDEVLVYESKDEPIRVGEYRQIQLTCCDSFRNQTTNLALRELPMNASIEMRLVSASDYAKRDRLKDVQFTAQDNLKLLASLACKKEIEADMANWQPAQGTAACRDY